MVEKHEEVRNDSAFPKTRRSKLARLPDDILTEIFFALKDNSNLQSWYHIIHVCRHWRCVALGVANLWTKPSTDLHDFTLLMLERSQKCLLEIEISFLTSNATCTAILSHIDHTRSILVEQSRESLEHLQHVLLASPHEAPDLTTLSVTQFNASSDDSFRLSSSTLRRLPSLNTLFLASIDFDWSIFPIYGLTSLSLVCIRMSNPPSWAQFHQALSEMRSLESLTIDPSNFDLIPPDTPPGPLELPLLRRIEIHQSLALVMLSFISNSSFPRLRNASLECLFMNPDLNEYSTIISAILALITRGDFDRLDNLVIGYDIFTISSISSSGLRWTDRFPVDFTACNWDSDNNLGSTRALITGLTACDLASQITHLCLRTSRHSRSWSSLDPFPSSNQSE